VSLENLQLVVVSILPIIFAITLHEAAHGYVAKLCGDRTAEMLGRVSLNPLRHIDPVGTILVPIIGLIAGGFFFGWAKPVPVNYRALNHPRLDSVLVAIAGPATNVLLAVISILLWRIIPFLPSAAQTWTSYMLAQSFKLNLILAVLNMLPVPPLDGGRVAVGLLPNPLSRQLAELEPIGIPLFIVVFFLVPMIGEAMHRNLDLFTPLIAQPAEDLGDVLLSLLGPGE
jgi:Zn-dependent protease